MAELWSQPCVTFSLSPQHLLVPSLDHELYTFDYSLWCQPSARCVAMESTVTSALGKAESNRAMWPQGEHHTPFLRLDEARAGVPTSGYCAHCSPWKTVGVSGQNCRKQWEVF